MKCRTLRNLLAPIAAFLAIGLAGGPAQADWSSAIVKGIVQGTIKSQISRSSGDQHLRDSFYSALQSEENIDVAIRQWGVPENRREIYKRHMKSLLSNSSFASYMYEQFVPLLGTFQSYEGQNRVALVQNFTLSLTSRLALRGLPRQEIESIRFFILHMFNFLSSLDDETCARLLRDEMDAMSAARLELQFLFSQEENVVRRYLSLIRESILSEIDERPSVKFLSRDENEFAENLLASRILEDENGELLLRGITETRSVSDRHLCWANERLMNIVSSQTGFAGDLVIIMTAISMREM